MTNETSKVTFSLPIAGETPITNGTVTFENVDDIGLSTDVIVKVGAMEEKKTLYGLSSKETAQLERSFARLGFDYHAFLDVHEKGEGYLLREVAARMGNETVDTAEGKKRLERTLYGEGQDFRKDENWSLAPIAALSRYGESLDALKALSKVKPGEKANAIKHLAEAASQTGKDYGSPRKFDDPLMTSACSFLEREVFKTSLSAYETAMKALPLVCPADKVYKIVTDKLPDSCRRGELAHLVSNTARPDDEYADVQAEPKSPRAPAPVPAGPVKERERPQVTELKNSRECEKPWLRRIAVRSLGGILRRQGQTEAEIQGRVAEDVAARSQTTTKLVESLLNDPDSSVRMAAAYALNRADSNDLFRFTSENPDQAMAVDRLRQHADGLQKKLKDLPERIRTKASQPDSVAKQETQDPFAWKAYPTVAEMEGEKDPHRLAGLVQRFGEGLLLLNGKSHLPLIVAFLSHPSAEVSLAAAHVLGHLPDDFWAGFGTAHPDSVSAIEKTVKALSDFAHNCRVISVAMGKSTSEAAVPGE